MTEMENRAAGLTALPNIGKEVARQLIEAGIDTPEKLYETGSRGAWLSIQQCDPSACLNRLYGLEGAIRGVKWRFLDETVKADLKAFYETHKMKWS